MMSTALVTAVLVLLFSCGVVPGISSEADGIASLIARSLHAISQDKSHPTLAAAGPGTVDSGGPQSPAQTSGESTSGPASGEYGSPPQTDLGMLLQKLWPAFGAAVSPDDHQSSSLHPMSTKAGSRSTEPDWGETSPDDKPIADNKNAANITALLPQFGTYWRALNDFLGDSDLGEPGTVDAALERLFGPSGPDHGEEGRSGASTTRSARSRGSTAAEKQHSDTVKEPKGQTEPPASPVKSKEAGDKAAKAYIVSPSKGDEASTSHTVKHTASNGKKNSTEPSSASSVKQSSNPTTTSDDDGGKTVTSSSVSQPKEHRSRPGSAWFRRHRPGRAFSALKRQLPGMKGALNNGTFGRMLADHLNAAARNNSRTAFSSASSLRMLGHLLVSRRAAAARNGSSNSNGTDSRSSNGGKSGRRPFSFKALARLIAGRRAAAAAGRNSGSSSRNDVSSALNGTSSSIGHELQTKAARNATNEITDKGINRNANGRPRPGRLPHRLPSWLGSRAATANATQRPPGRQDALQMDAWTTSASSLLVGLLTPGRLADTVSEAVGRASSRLADRLLDRLTRPLQTVTGRASSSLSRLPKLLAPAQRLVMGDLADPVRPPTTYGPRRPRSEMERLQRRLGYSESSERAAAAELARLRRRLREQRLAGRAHWSVEAAERNGDMMAHLWTLQP